MKKLKWAALFFGVVVLLFVVFQQIGLDLSSPTALRDSIAGRVALVSDQGRQDAGDAPRAIAHLPSPSLKANPTDKDFLDSILVAKQLDQLEARARRDPAFAYALSFALSQCAHADKSYRKLGETADDKILASAESRLDMMTKAYAKCAGLTDAQMAKRYDMVTGAARAGVLNAQVDYKHIMSDAFLDGSLIRRPNGVDEFRGNVEGFTIAAARTGDRGALNNAYALYSDGRVVPRDPVRAYQYMEQLARIDPWAASQLPRLQAQLTPEQLRRARGG